MPSFVYSCEKCSSELRFLLSRPLEGVISIHCPNCKDLRKFNLAREGNIGKDWFSKIIIQNKKRRDEDSLYKKPSPRDKAIAS